MIGIAFDVDHLRGDVLRFVAQGMDDDSAAHRAIRASGTRLRRLRNFKLLCLCIRLLHIEAERGGNDSASGSLYKRSSRRNRHVNLRSSISKIVSLPTTA